MIDETLILAFVAAVLLAIAVSLRTLVSGRIRAIKIRIDFIQAMKRRLR